MTIKGKMEMENFLYPLGHLVTLDPTGSGRGPVGRVIGQTNYLDGSRGYTVTVFHLGANTLQRHSVSECEICYPAVSQITAALSK